MCTIYTFRVALFPYLVLVQRRAQVSIKLHQWVEMHADVGKSKLPLCFSTRKKWCFLFAGYDDQGNLAH